MVAMINEEYVKRGRQCKVVGKLSDGRLALDFLEKNEVDLMILDVFMPRMNGIELMQQIREKGIGVDVIMVTAANDRDTLGHALRLGAVDYLVKPFAFDRFQTAIDKFIAHTEALKGMNVLNQQSIESLIANSAQSADVRYPKGIQARTLQMIMDFMAEAHGTRLTGDIIAENVGLSGVTVRRYMNYLAETGAVKGEIDYCTGGRPCMVYSLTDGLGR